MLLHPHGSPGVLLLLLAEGFPVATGVVAVLGGEAAANLVDFGDGIVGGVRCGDRCVHFSASRSWNGVARIGVCKPRMS